MPTMDVVPLREAQLELSLSGKRGALMREYIGYINDVEDGQAGKLTPNEGETTTAIRRRLTSAAALLGKEIESTRQGEVVYFWAQGSAPPRRRGGRRRASAS